MTSDKLLVVGLAWTGLLLGLVLLRIVLRRSRSAGAARALPVVSLLTAVMVLAVGAMAVVRVSGLAHPPTTVAEGRSDDGRPGAEVPSSSASPSDRPAASPAPPTHRSSPVPASITTAPQVMAPTPAGAEPTPAGAEPTPAGAEPTPAPRVRPAATDIPSTPTPAPMEAAAVATPSPRAPAAAPTAPPTPVPAATPIATPLPMQDPAAPTAPPAVAAGPGTLRLPARVRVYSVEGGQVSGYATSSLARSVTVRGIGPGHYPMPTLSDPAATTQLVLISEGKLLGKLVSLDDEGVTFIPD